MPKVNTTVAKSFIWPDGHTNTLIKKGEQALTKDQFEHAKKQGFLLDPPQVAGVKNKPAKENTHE